MKINSLFKAGLATLILASSSNVFAIEAKDVMQKSHDVKKPAFTMSAVQMDLFEKGGALQESRQLKQYGRDKNDLTSMVMVFLSPASVKDTRFLQIENKDKDDDKFIYLPTLKQTRRIAASEGTKSFMGTDATYDDMSSREVEEDNHEMVNENEEKNFICFCYCNSNIQQEGFPHENLRICRKLSGNYTDAQ